MSLSTLIRQRFRPRRFFIILKSWYIYKSLNRSIGTILSVQTIEKTFSGKVDAVNRDYMLMTIGDRLYEVRMEEILRVFKD